MHGSLILAFNGRSDARSPQRDSRILKHWARFALYQIDSCQIRTWPFFYDNKASCQLSSKSVENFLRYGVLKISFGRGLRSIWAILVNIELDLPFIITKLPAKFHRNRSRTFWVILITDRKTDRLTSKTIPIPKHCLGQGNDNPWFSPLCLIFPYIMNICKFVYGSVQNLLSK